MTFESEPARGEDVLPTTYNLLFVCTGNTCRSPLAAVIAERAVSRRAWTHVLVRSAGIATSPGAPASAGALAVAHEQGLDLSTHSSQPLTPDLVAWADLILAMSPAHLMGIAELGAADKAALVTDFLDHDAGGSAVADPFGGDLDAYRDTFTQLNRAIAGLLVRLEPILSP
jgi:protein-tyrosine-phosphatase